jgi:hypothetical protein
MLRDNVQQLGQLHEGYGTDRNFKRSFPTALPGCQAGARRRRREHDGLGTPPPHAALRAAAAHLMGTVYHCCTPHARLRLAPWGRQAVCAEDTGHDRQDHGSVLECASTIVVSRAAASLDTTQAT